jgi:hypothetical protein
MEGGISTLQRLITITLTLYRIQLKTICSRSFMHTLEIQVQLINLKLIKLTSDSLTQRKCDKSADHPQKCENGNT